MRCSFFRFPNYVCISSRSLFCLCPAGDTPSSARLFDAIVSGCIPVIVSDELELPFEGILDYRKVCQHRWSNFFELVYVFIKVCMSSSQVAVIVSSSDAIQPGWLVNHLRSLLPSQVKKFQNSLAQVSLIFPSSGFSIWHQPYLPYTNK